MDTAEPSVGIDALAQPAYVDVSVVVVNYNTAHLLHEMRDALNRSQGSLTLQTIIIDNASRDESAEVLRRDFSDAELIFNTRNVGFGRANNQALPLVTGRYVLLLNTDAFVSPDTLTKTVAYMDAHSDAGILGVRLVGRDGVLQPSCRYFPTPWNVFLNRTGLHRFFPGVRMVDDMSWDHASVRECDWVPGCYYLVRRELIEQVGLFDPRYFLYYEEVDHCRAAKRRGWRVVCFSDVEVVHLGGESAKSEGKLTAAGRQLSALQVESELLYFRKQHGLPGLMAGVLLQSLVFAISSLRRKLRRASQPQTGGLQQLSLLWRALLSTRVGSRPTR